MLDRDSQKEVELVELADEVSRLKSELATVPARAPIESLPFDPAAPLDLGQLLARLEAHRGHVDQGFETWTGVQVTLAKAIKDLLLMAQKEPSFGSTVYPMLDSLKAITDSGRAILDGSKSHLETQSELLKAVAGSSAEG
jgi:hypothetical protein